MPLSVHSPCSFLWNLLWTIYNHLKLGTEQATIPPNGADKHVPVWLYRSSLLAVTCSTNGATSADTTQGVGVPCPMPHDIPLTHLKQCMASGNGLVVTQWGHCTHHHSTSRGEICSCLNSGWWWSSTTKCSTDLHSDLRFISNSSP